MKYVLLLLLLTACGGEGQFENSTPMQNAPKRYGHENWLLVGQSNMNSTVASYFSAAMEQSGIPTSTFLAQQSGTTLNCWRSDEICYTTYVEQFEGQEIDGIFFWQGESDALGYGEVQGYGELFTTLIQEYREVFGNVPFIYVQLENYDSDLMTPEIDETSDWARVRQEQQEALVLDDVYEVETLDITLGDIHPIESYQEVALRAVDIILDL